MPKYYLDLAVLDETDPIASCKLGTSAIMSLSGNNIGNFAFRHALRFIVRDLHSYSLTLYPSYQRAAQLGQVDSTIVSCANWLGASQADEASNLNRARAFEATDASTVCFAIGVQAKSGADSVDLGPNTLRLAKALSERAKLLSVRDEMTQNVLEAAGITNTVVTGCPSNFINGDPELGKKVAARAAELLKHVASWRDVKSLICEFSGGSAESGRVLKHKLRLLDATPAHYVLQAPTLLPFTLRETREIPSVYKSNSPFGNEHKRLEITLRSKCIHFSSINAWMDYARTCDLSFGMRIHGNMIPLQAGVPSVLISHDSRTSGLGSVMGIPNVSAENFTGEVSSSPRFLLETVVKTMGDYDARRRVLAKTMVNYLSANNIAPHISLLTLAGETSEP